MDLDYRRKVVDVGAGDGRWVYEQARRNANSLYIALDPDAEALKEYAYRASRKPARGGAENTLFVVGVVEDPPVELLRCADELHVNFPWAALLRGLLLAEQPVLRGLAALAAPGATFELVLTYDPAHDHGAGLGSDVEAPSLAFLESLADGYARAGLRMEEWRRISRSEALAIPSSWGHRLLHGRDREVFVVSGRVEGSA